MFPKSIAPRDIGSFTRIGAGDGNLTLKPVELSPINGRLGKERSLVAALTPVLVHMCCFVRAKLSFWARVLTRLMAKYVATLARSTEMTGMMSVVTTVLKAKRLFSVRLSRLLGVLPIFMAFGWLIVAVTSLNS